MKEDNRRGSMLSPYISPTVRDVKVRAGRALCTSPNGGEDYERDIWTEMTPSDPASSTQIFPKSF